MYHHPEFHRQLMAQREQERDRRPGLTFLGWLRLKLRTMRHGS